MNKLELDNVTTDDFAHLHLHTQYSLLDGAIHIERLIEKAKSLDMKSIAITDHGVMYGVIDFYKQCKKNGIKPIIGMEAYISPNSRKDRDYVRRQTSNYHIILLAENNIGYANLIKLASIAQIEGFYMRPRIDKEILKEYSEGVIALSACLGGEISQKILSGDYTSALEAVLEYKDIMGDGNYFLEIQKNGIPEQDIVNRQLENISLETGVPLVATCDCHYLNKGDHISHTVLTCIQTVTTMSNPDRMEMASDELYFKSKEEMIESFRDYPEAVLNAARIASRCSVEIDFSQTHLPVYDIPSDFKSADDYFRHLSLKGLEERLKKVDPDKHDSYRQRLDVEMDVIILKGYVGYFLIVWDFINYAKENNVYVGPGRGSGAGSLVAYSLKITDIDPIRFNLLFERFLNPERPSLPDFDIDFCVKKRDLVIQYVRNKYGHDKVAQIITFGRLSGRSVVKDVCRVLEIPISESTILAKNIPEAPGMTLSRALREDPNVRKAFEKHEKGAEVLQHSLNLEGLLRHSGMHAAGVVIADKPLVEYVPLARGKRKGGAGEDEAVEVLAQFEKGLLEDLGLVKFDFLGLANLTIIGDTVDRIRAELDPNFDISNINYSDEAVYEMLSNGESTGVFQFESDGMRRLMKKLRPSVLEDLIALNALYRPGPINGNMLDLFCNRKHGIEKVVYTIPELEGILSETYGVIVYQEQVMEIARLVAGYSLGSADMLRRAMGKKDVAEMERHKKIFIEGDDGSNIAGARKLGFDIQAVEELYELIKEFAEYGFNKSHSAAYAVLAYQTAYLKCKYPAQFLSACMSSEETKLEKIIPYINDARSSGIDVCAPNINVSSVDFEYKNGAIWFGLKSIKNVGHGAALHIVDVRESGGEFKSLYDFCNRIDLRCVNKKVIESLIDAGAMDCFDKHRSQHIAVLQDCMRKAAMDQKMKETGIMSIESFIYSDEDIEESEDYPDIPELPELERLYREKAVLSFYFSSHPIESAINMVGNYFDNIYTIQNSAAKDNIRVVGLLNSFKKLKTKKSNEDMAAFTLEDLTGSINCMVFPKIYKQYFHKLANDSVVVVIGKSQSRDGEDEQNIIVDKILSFEEALNTYPLEFEIFIPYKQVDNSFVTDLKSMFSQHIGGITSSLIFDMGNGYSIKVQLPQKYFLKLDEKLFNELREKLGPSCFKIIFEERQEDRTLYKYDDLYRNRDLYESEYEYDHTV